MLERLNDILSSQIFLLTLTVGVFYASQMLYKRFKYALLNPLLVSMFVIILILKVLDIDYDTYYEANRIINFLLGLSVVALGYLLYENIEHIKGKERSIITSLLIGSFIGIVSVIGIAMLFGMDKQIILSLHSKSVTTPIAVMISENSGGIPSITVVAVIFAGIIGVILGPQILSCFKIKDPVARGLALGAASHAMGTVRAMELGVVEGAIGGAAIGLMGIFTTLMIPVIEKILF